MVGSVYSAVRTDSLYKADYLFFVFKTLLGEPIEWVDITRYLGVTLDTRLTW